MTIILVHNDPTTQEIALVEWLNEILGQSYNDVSQLINNPDIHQIHNPPEVSIKIEEVKNFQKEMLFKPFQNSHQVGIIYNSDRLTTEAQNALLKTLEEQSDSTHYILLVKNEKSLLPTILTRGKKYYPKSQETKNSLEDLLDLTFTSDVVETFVNIEQLVESEKEQKGRIEQVLTGLEAQYQLELQSQIEADNKTEIATALLKIDAILSARQRLNRNVNKRLLLENLAIQLSGPGL